MLRVRKRRYFWLFHGRFPLVTQTLGDQALRHTYQASACQCCRRFESPKYICRDLVFTISGYESRRADHDLVALADPGRRPIFFSRVLGYNGCQGVRTTSERTMEFFFAGTRQHTSMVLAQRWCAECKPVDRFQRLFSARRMVSRSRHLAQPGYMCRIFPQGRAQGLQQNRGCRGALPSG